MTVAHLLLSDKVRPKLPISQETRVYAIAFDLDQENLKAAYPGDSPQNGYTEIKKILGKHNFSRQQGSVYFGDKTVNAVSCFLAVTELTTSLPWFAAAVKDIRMLRIEELNDLMPVIESVAEINTH